MIDPKKYAVPSVLLVENARSLRIDPLLVHPHGRRWRRLSLNFPAGRNAENLGL